MSKTYTINEISQKLHLTPFYVRKCIREKKLKSTLVQLSNKDIFRHEVSEEDLREWIEKRKEYWTKRIQSVQL